MTLNDARAKDKRFTLVACIAFVLAMILYVVSSQIAGDTGRKSAFSGDLVFADVTSTPQVIRITTNRSDYQLRNADGVWVMPEKADYPVQINKIEQMLNAIASARFTDAKTALPERHDALGLGDPMSGGTGALITLPGLDETGAVIGEKRGLAYGRRGNSDQTWQVDALFPALHSANWWLDFSGVFPRPSSAVQSVEIRSGDGESLQKITPSETEALGPEDMILLEAASSQRVLDVASLDEIGTLSPVLSHTTRFQDGRELTLTLYDRSGRSWAHITGSALDAPELVEGRIFQLDPITASDLIPSE